MIPEEKAMVFDPIRKKRVALTPEEYVRQAMVHHLITWLHYPISYISNEYSITMGKLSRRCDTVVFDSTLSPLMVLEYKAPEVPITQKVIEQAFQYNSVLRVPFICLSNSIVTYVYRIGYHGDATIQLPQIPTYEELLQQL